MDSTCGDRKHEVLLTRSGGALWGLLFGAAFFHVPGFGLLGEMDSFVSILAGAAEGPVVVGVDKYLLIVHGGTEEVEQTW